MMATFMAVLVPAGRGVRRPHPGGARHRVVGGPAGAPGHRGRPGAARSSCATSASTTPAPRSRCSTASRSRRSPGRRRRSSAAPAPARRRWSTWCPACSTSPPAQVLVDGVDVRDSTPTLLWSRIGLVPQRPYLFSGHGGQQPALRQARRHRRRAVGGAARSPRRADFVGAMPGGLDAPIAPGRHERVRRPAPAAGHRPGAGAQARDLPVRRLVLGARPGHRRPAAGGAGARTPPTRTVIVVAQRVSTIATADQILVLEDGRDGRPRHPRRAARHVPDVRRDRRLADRRRRTRRERRRRASAASERRRADDGQREGNGEPSTGRRRPSAPAPVPGARSACRPRSRRTSARAVRRLLGRMRAGATAAASPSWRSAVASVTLAVLGPKSSATPPTSSSSGVVDSQSGIDFGELHRVLARRVAAVRRRRPCCTYLQALPAGRRRAAHDVPPARRRRGQAQPPAAALRRPPAARRPAEPVTNDIDNVAQSLQQTLSQLLTSVLTLVGVLVMMILISPLLALVALVTIPLSLLTDAVIARRSRPRFVAQWRTPARSTPRSRRRSPATPSSRRSAASRRSRSASPTRTRSCTSASFGAQFVSGIIQPAMMFLGNLQLRRHRRDRRAAGVGRGDDASATSRRSSSTPASSPSR